MNRLFLFVISCILCICTACEPTDIGAVLQPEEDKMVVVTDSFSIESVTHRLLKRHSELDKLELGYVSDPVYGSFKLDFLTEFRYSRDTFPASATDAVLQLVMYYRSFYGDSLAVNEASVYALDKALDFEANYTSDIELSEYCSKSQLLAKKAYVAYDATVSDSVRKEDFYCDKVVIDLPQSYCQDLLTNRQYTQGQDAFLQFLKGLYVTTNYGTKTVLNIDSVNLEMKYKYAPVAAKPDSLVEAVRIYPANRETTEVMRVSEVQEPANVALDSVNYVVSSSGYVTQLTLPLERIRERMREGTPKGEKLNINHISLVVEEAVMDDAAESDMLAPPILLLIQEKDLDAFFTQSKYPADGINTTLGAYDEEEHYYVFNNMATYLEGILSNDSTDVDGLNHFYLVPVSGATEIAGTNAVIRHLFKPHGVRLRSASNATSPMRLTVTFTNL